MFSPGALRVLGGGLLSTLATVDPQRLKLLSPNEAVDLFRDLLWAEAGRQGVNLLDVNVPSNITAADGGVDAEVGAAPATGGLLAAGLTRFQIKTGDFSASIDSQLKDLFFKKDSTEFKERVAHCFANNGTFVIVLFGSDNPETSDETTTVTRCQNYLKKYHPGLVDPTIKVLRANHLAGFLSQYIALAFRAQGIAAGPFRTHREWSGQSDMMLPIAYGPIQTDLLAQIRLELRKSTAAVHVCLAGEPGAGKTRLALEATRTADLAPLVAYCKSPEQCAASGLVDLLLHDERRQAILIVDDCDIQDAQSLWNALEHQGARMKLVTLQHEIPRMGGSSSILAVPPLSGDQILEILQQYVPGNQGRGFVGLCSGSPRVAHVLGNNLARYPNDLLQPPDTVDVWGRYISGTDDPDSELVRERHTILRYCALFKKFGFKKPVHEELRAIATLVQRDHPEVGNGKILAAIGDLRGRRILQGDATLYITPKALHIKLWGEWWDAYGEMVDFEALVNGLPDTLRKWFFEMFRYAKESAVAGRIVERLLGPDGPFVTTSLLNSASGAEVFSALAEANPERALRCLEQTIGQQSFPELIAATESRRYLVWSLERVAIWRAHFARAAQLLERLALAENEHRIANNATGVFCDLFSLAPGDVAPTEAPPEERFPILERMIASANSAERALAIKAGRIALNYGHFVRTSSSDHHGLQLPPQRWMPKTYSEWFAAYEHIWTVLRTAFTSVSPEEQELIADVLIDNAYELAQIPRLSPVVAATLMEIARTQRSRRRLIEHVQLVIDNIDRIPQEFHVAWHELQQLVNGGDDFTSRLQRFVGMASWRFQSKHDGGLQEALQRLAQDAVHDPELLRTALPWLLSKEAENAHAFGYQAGRADKDGALWPMLLSTAAALHTLEYAGFMGGYLRAAVDRNEKVWLEHLDEASAMVTLQAILHELIAQSRLNDASAALLTRLIRDGKVPSIVLRRFTIGNELRNLSDRVFSEWRTLLRTQEPAAAQAVVELLHAYYIYGGKPRPLPIAETVAALTDEHLFAEGVRGGRLTDEAWRKLAVAATEQCPTQTERLVTTVVDHFGVECAVMHEYGDSGPVKWLNEIAAHHPVLVWNVVKERLGPPIDSRAFRLMHWVKGDSFDQREENFLDAVPRDAVWAWVDTDVEKRAWYLAKIAAPTVKQPSLARDVLIRHGDREEVRNELIANFDTEGWVGLESGHYSGKGQRLRALLDVEQHPVVRAWLTEYLEYLDRRIGRAKVSEERDF